MTDNLVQFLGVELMRVRGWLWILAAACPALVACETPPRVTTSWASKARQVVSGATPRDEERTAYADYGPEDDRDRDPLESLSEDEDLGEVIVELQEGVYRLYEPVLLREVKTFVLQGRGPHKTRLELDTEAKGSLLLTGAERIVVRDLTLVGYTGGGLRIKGCGDVRVENVHFAGLRFGLEFESSTASVGTSVFDGCQQGVVVQSGTLRVENSVFRDCWVAVDGRGAIQIASCAFIENRDAIKARLNARSSVVGSVFAGEEQALAWSGRPQTAASNLVHEMEIGKRVGSRTNRGIVHAEEFPDALRHGFPPDFAVVPVYMAIERANFRGQADPPQELEDVAIDRAMKEADACKLASVQGDLARAKVHAQRALDYLAAVGLDLEEAPESIKGIAGLVN